MPVRVYDAGYIWHWALYLLVEIIFNFSILSLMFCVFYEWMNEWMDEWIYSPDRKIRQSILCTRIMIARETTIPRKNIVTVWLSEYNTSLIAYLESLVIHFTRFQFYACSSAMNPAKPIWLPESNYWAGACVWRSCRKALAQSAASSTVACRRATSQQLLLQTASPGNWIRSRCNKNLTKT